MSKIEGWMEGEAVVEFRAGVKVLKSGETWGRGDVYRVYQKKYYEDKTFRWSRCDRLFTRDGAIAEASSRALFEESYYEKWNFGGMLAHPWNFVERTD